MHMVVTSDETRIQTVTDWPMSHAKRVKRDNRNKVEYHIVVAIRSTHAWGIVPSCELATFASESSRRQGWIQTSATSLQKLVRIVKKSVPEYLNARCQFLPGVQLQDLLIPNALHLLPASSGPAP